MIRRPPRSTPLYSSAASDVYKRQTENDAICKSERPVIVALDRDVNPNWRVMQFTPSVAIMVGAAILSTPADKRARFGPALKGGAGVHPKRRFSFADAMAVMQAALSVVLLIAAGLFLRSLHSLRS